MGDIDDGDIRCARKFVYHHCNCSGLTSLLLLDSPVEAAPLLLSPSSGGSLSIPRYRPAPSLPPQPPGRDCHLSSARRRVARCAGSAVCSPAVQGADQTPKGSAGRAG